MRVAAVYIRAAVAQGEVVGGPAHVDKSKALLAQAVRDDAAFSAPVCVRIGRTVTARKPVVHRSLEPVYRGGREEEEAGVVVVVVARCEKGR